MVILEGASGSGKSTLLRCIVYLEKPAGGAVYWSGEEVGEDNIRRFRRHVVYVHQTPVAIAPTVEENLAFPRQMAQQLDDSTDRGMTEEEQRELLDHFGLGAVDWTRRFDELSVGEQQRVALVRCLSVRPDVLLLDEPTASLDEENARLVEACIDSILAEDGPRAVVWISHNEKQRDRLDGRRLQIESIQQT